MIENHLMNEAGVSCPVILGFWLRKRNMECEIGIGLFNSFEIIQVEKLPDGTAAIPECSFAVGVLCVELIKNMRAHWRHTGTTTDKHHFLLRVFNVKFTVRSTHHHFVAGFERKNIA
ncbi:hypothetical protein SDC9_65971 [bioreactor metagenome]|uniref:Uncharacterized protein n=1 Tax=bioreactor metagenome TaxID=1076179 RepID=A0A644XTR3_9ZZZZ